MLDKFKGALIGKKTYITAIIAVATALGGYLAGDMGGSDALNLVYTALIGAFIRNGIK